MLRHAILAAALLLASCATFAQTNVLKVGRVATIKAKIGATIDVKVPFELASGYHVNSNTPSDPYLIPLRITWDKDKKGELAAGDIVFPKPSMEKYSFSATPLSVFSGVFEITTKFKVAPTAIPGPTAINAKLRYQACNDRECLAPKTLDVAVQVDVVR